MKKIIELNTSRVKKVFIACLCVLFMGTGQTAMTKTESSLTKEEKSSDSEKTYPEKRKSQETWESIVSFPGKIIFFPIKLFLSGVGTLAAYIDEEKVIPKVVEVFTSEDGRRGIHPVYSNRTGGGLKFYLEDLLTQGSKLAFQVTAGPRWRQKYKAAFQEIQINNAIYADITASSQIFPDEFFYGLGNTSIKTNKSNYTHKQAILELALGFKISETLKAHTQIGYEANKIQEGRNRNLPSATDPNLYIEETIPGLMERINLGKLSLTLHYDGKNHPGRPTAGSELIVSGSVFNELGGNAFGFWKASVNASHYINLFYNRILVFRLAGEFSQALPNKRIPFYHLSEIGRRETIRGFDRGRYRANDMILGSFEYRYPIWTYLDALLFLDAGQVSEDIFNDFSIQDFHVGYGGGLRVWGEKSMIARFEVGKSKDGFRFYFALFKAF